MEAKREEKFVYKGDDTVCLNWETRGFKLHVPKDASPPGVNEVSISVKAATSCECILPANTELVSGVYAVSTSHVFTKPVTLEVEHSCFFESPDCAGGLIFGRCSKDNGPPYHFEILEGGSFSTGNKFGSVSLKKFSRFAVLRNLLSSFAPSVRYSASLYYSADRKNRWHIYFVITRDTKILKQVLKNDLHKDP